MNITMSKELRRFIRTAFTTRVSIRHPKLGAYVAKTRDLSQGGVFLILDKAIDIKVDDIVDLQTLDMPAEAPIVKARVLRIESEGIACCFMDEV